jgi:hypothetical protein
MRFGRSGLAALVLAVSSPAIGCGGAPPPAAAPAKGPAIAPIAPSAPVAADLSAVPRPEGVMMTAHLSKPDRSLKVLGELLGSAVPHLVGLSAEQIASVLLGPTLTDIVDFTQPFDAVLMTRDTAGGSPAFAVSAALTSLDDYEQAFKEGSTHFASGMVGGHCHVRPAAGSAPQRLVCATDGATLAATTPYLTRTVARMEGRADAHVEIAIAPLLPFVGGSIHDPKEDAEKSASRLAGEEMGRAIATEVLNDFDSVAFDLALERSSADVTFTARFKETKSAIARILVKQGKDARPIPETFWRLPADAGGATYLRGLERSDFDGLRAFLKKEVFDEAELDGVPPAAVARARAALDTLFLTGGPVAFAHGFDAEAAKKAVSLAPPKSLKDKQAEDRALSGWFVFGLEEASTRWVDGLREMIAVDKVQYKPKRPQTKSESKTDLFERAIKKEDKLPPGSFHMAVETTPKPRAKGADASKPLPLASTYHVYVAPEGARTWLAIGPSEALALGKLHAVLDASAPGSTLARRSGLGALHDVRTNAAGFVTVDELGRASLTTDGTEKNHAEARARIEALAALAGHGSAPITFVVEGENPTENAVSLRMSVPRAALTDIIALGLASH